MQNTYRLNEEGNRPWGSWQVVAMGKGYVVKKIVVLPYQALSLQMHHHRGEHWLVSKGEAFVTLGEDSFSLVAGKAVDIPKKTKHQLQNLTDETLEVIEIQMGQILNEEDIIRFKDRYNRINRD